MGTDTVALVMQNEYDVVRADEFALEAANELILAGRTAWYIET